MMHDRFLLALAALPALLVMIVEARRVAPLLEDDLARRPHRPAECMFGKQIRELGSTWYADLGPPFGVMYCIKCECIPVQKKRRIVARVQCRNIKNECPKPTCEEPVLLPGRCCKTCPGDYSPDIAQDVPPQMSLEEEERSLKHFATLLTGKTSLPLRRDDLTPSSALNDAYNYVATGRFSFHRKNLYYSFYLSSSTPRPRSLQFVDTSGSILEEQTINPIGGVYQNATGKLCGVWRRVPRDYRKLLREERLHVALIWGPSATLTGQLSRYRSLATEQFSALLEPTTGADRSLMSGAGATAIVSASTASAPSIHVLLIFNGLFFPSEISDVPITVQLEHLEKRYVILREDIIVGKPSIERNIGEVRSPLSGADLRLLARGKLGITVSSRSDPQALSLHGAVGPRATCDLYQTLLSSEVPSSASGLAWAFLDRGGALRYGVQVVGLEDESPILTLVDEGGKRRTELEDLTPALLAGLANGSIERPGPRLLEPLFSGELGVVAASHLGSVLRGRLIQKPVADARDTSAPILLRRVDSELPVASGMMSSLVWASVDLDCTLHYELEITGLADGERTLQLHLETMPLIAQGAPVARRLLEEFNGPVLEGSVTGLSPVELYRIESGISYLEVRDKTLGAVLKAPFKTRTPLSCLPHYADNDVASVVAYNMQPPRSDVENSACFYAHRFYEEGTQWTAKSDVCTMCHCHRGLTSCDTVPCPVTPCPDGQVMKTMPGHCCPICTTVLNLNETQSNVTVTTTPGSRGCMLAGQYHLAGAAWHPYVPPAGFDTCAVCTCDVFTLEVKCPRVQCPPLDCDEKMAFRPDKKACCRQCLPAAKSVATPSTGDMLPRDQATVSTRRTAEEILAGGGCKYPVGGPFENGKEWHPRIHSHGEMKCVKCKCKPSNSYHLSECKEIRKYYVAYVGRKVGDYRQCKSQPEASRVLAKGAEDGEVKCDRKRCPRALCNTIARQKKQGSLVSDIDDCCSVQCRRARRHHRLHHHQKRTSRREPRS